MNRVIEFRARWRDTGKIIPDFSLEYAIDACNDPVFIVEQFTGLHDATKWGELSDAEKDAWQRHGGTEKTWKGRPVFEGDKISAQGYEWAVEWHGGAYHAMRADNVMRRMLSHIVDVCYVIGNIHDGEVRDVRN